MPTFARRFLVVVALAAATTMVSWPALAAQKRADLVLDAIRWSENLGETWSNNPILEGSDVWFEAVVRSDAGTAATPSGRLIEVYFQINGALVAVSNTVPLASREGLASPPGQHRARLGSILEQCSAGNLYGSGRSGSARPDR
jgi:hypothetical protein